MSKVLKVAIQKSGRLNENSVKLFKEAGIQFDNGLGMLKTQAINFPLELFMLRDDDIPQYVADGVADVGIVGENVFLEKKLDLPVVDRLGFGRCRLSIAISKEQNYGGIKELAGKKIATSYPKILNDFLLERGIEAEIHEISGSVEIAPGIGLADAICDLVSSGSTLLVNGLKEVEVLLQSEAILVASGNMDSEKQIILDRLLFRIASVRRATRNKYILLNAPNENIEAICNVLPGMKSPTVLPLQLQGWSSIHSVVAEDRFWDVIDQLKNYGAQGILVVPIEKMIA